MDILMTEVNKNKDLYKMEMIYSTPQDYVRELQQYNKISTQHKLSENIYDFQPYADDEKSYWTGYFTSRVADKVQVRKTGRWL